LERPNGTVLRVSKSRCNVPGADEGWDMGELSTVG